LINIEPLDISDANIDNNQMTVYTDNNYLSYEEGNWQNWNTDTCILSSDFYKSLIIDKNYGNSYVLGVFTDSNQYSLEQYGAEQSNAKILRIISDDENLSVYCEVLGSALSQEDIMVYYNETDNKLYKTDQDNIQGVRIFSLKKAS
jgi:hypothetical protein